MHHFITSIVDTGTSFDLTTVEAVNAEFGVAGNTADDAVTSDKITFYSRMIASLCDRVFALETVAETFRFSEHVPVISLSRYPVTEITAITLNGSALIADSDYEFSPQSGLVWKPSGCFGGCPTKLVATYTGGYSLPTDAPEPLTRACIELIKDARFNATRDSQIRSVAHTDLSVTYANVSKSQSSGGIPEHIAGLIAPFRRLGV